MPIIPQFLHWSTSWSQACSMQEAHRPSRSLSSNVNSYSVSAHVPSGGPGTAGLTSRSAPVNSRELTITSSLCSCCTSSIPCIYAAGTSYLFRSPASRGTISNLTVPLHDSNCAPARTYLPLPGLRCKLLAHRTAGTRTCLPR